MIAQIPLSRCHGLRGYGLGKDGIFHGIGRQHRQIPGTGIMTGAVQSVGVFKMGVAQPQKPCLVVHQLHKALHRAPTADGQRYRCIVARGQHQSVQQLLNRQHLPLPQVHGRAFDPHRLLGNAHPIQHVAPFAYHKGRHNLGGAGDQAPAVGVFIKQHPAADGIQGIGLFGADRVSFPGQNQNGGQQSSRRSGEESFHLSHPGIGCPGKNVLCLYVFPSRQTNWYLSH